MEFVSVVVGGHNVQEQDVFGFGVQAGHSEFHLREHLPAIGEKINNITYSITKTGNNQHKKKRRRHRVWAPISETGPPTPPDGRSSRGQRQLNSPRTANIFHAGRNDRVHACACARVCVCLFTRDARESWVIIINIVKEKRARKAPSDAVCVCVFAAPFKCFARKSAAHTWLMG